MNFINEKVSGLIITKNEEKNIAEVIENLNFCDEIIVVDSYSNDKTAEIAKGFPNVKVLFHEFEDFTKQRNYTLEQASNEWILFLDADERIPLKLKTEIINELNKAERKDAYYFYRTFFYEGKKIHFSGTRHDKNIRLFRKSKCTYSSHKKVHETLDVKGNIGILKNKLLHFSAENYHSYKEKMLHYGNLKGQELYQKGKRFNYAIQYTKTCFKFLKEFFIDLGFLDGKEGFEISFLHSLYVYQTYNSLKSEQKKY